VDLSDDPDDDTIVGGGRTFSEHPRLPDSHLQSLIRPIVRQCIFESEKKIPVFLTKTIQTLPVKPTLLNIHSEACYGKILQIATQVKEEQQPTEWVDTHYTEAYNTVKTLLDQTHTSLNLPESGVKNFMRREDRVWLSELQ
jgi:hypothetical protein